LIVLLRRTVRICAVAFAAAALYAVVVPPLAPVLFGPRYSPSVHVAQLLCVHQAISMVAAPLNIIGFGFGLARQYVWVNAVAFVVVCAVNWMLVPHLGPIGAAVGWITYDLVALVASIVLLKRSLGIPEAGAGATTTR
jgi:O-antigen/teichoic acid export membrane protein